ncbi:YidB family protein [Paraburkholderia aromaticivorans]|uniref:YidB family protein n=1 Tax=Paraburkholderia aromaticivorans TaxID=2026199 RepID=UPI0038B713C2
MRRTHRPAASRLPSTAPRKRAAFSPADPSSACRHSRETVMSLLDTLGSLVGKSPEGGGQQALVAAALEFVNNQPGGLNGLIDRFKEKGLGDVVASWVSNGENQPIAADALHSVLGSETVTNLAAKAGVQPDQVTGLLSQILPHVVNAATPEGEVPAEGKLNATTVLGALGGLSALFGKGNA